MKPAKDLYFQISKCKKILLLYRTQMDCLLAKGELSSNIETSCEMRKSGKHMKYTNPLEIAISVPVSAGKL